MSILDRIIGFLAPHECLGCGMEGYLLCPACASGDLLKAPSSCYRCKRPNPGYAACNSCLAKTELSELYAATEYSGIAKDLIWQLKYNGAQAAAHAMAQLMARTFPEDLTDCIIVPVPTTTARVRQRGYDQAVLLARELSRLTDWSSANCLARHGQTHQVGTGRAQRKTQLQGVFRVRPSLLLDGKRILLIDDVLTTGATLEAAARALADAGVTTIVAATFTAA